MAPVHVLPGRLTLGRIPGKNKAVALITVDDPIPETIIKAIAKLSQVERVLALRF